MRQKLSRRQAAISGKQDQMEQKRDRQMLKKTEVVVAEEVAKPTINTNLPTLDEDEVEVDRADSDKASSYGDEVKRVE